MTRARIELFAAALAVCSLFSIRAAHAEPLRASLVVTRGEGADDCPDTAGISARVRHITGWDVVQAVGDEPHETWVQVELVRVLSGYRAVIAARGRREGTRSIEDVGPGCSSLADAVAITLVMLLDPDVPQESPEVLPPAPLARTAPAKAAPKESATAREPKRNRARATEFRFGGDAGAGASVAVLAHAVPLVEAGGRLRAGSLLSFALGGGLLLPDRVVAPGGSVDLGLLYAYLRTCAQVVGGTRSELALCLSPLVGSLSGSGRNYDEYDERRLLWAAAAGAAELRAPLSESLFWYARVLVLAPLLRQGFSVETGAGPTRAFRTPPVGGMLSLGVSAEL